MARSVGEFIPSSSCGGSTAVVSLTDKICTEDHGTLNLNADTSITTNTSAYHYIDTAVILYVEMVWTKQFLS